VILLKNLNQRQSNPDRINKITGLLNVLAEKELENSVPYKIPENQRQVYKTIGGAAHLDQNYTVFGEVVNGLDVVDSIAKVQTDSLDRPVNDVRIISAKLIKRKNYN
jgi:peptidyl-prolyl cis-trans isomerase B (cyclophilin B)